MAGLEYVSVLEDIKHLVLDDKLSCRGICTEMGFDATVERCRAKQAKWKTTAQDMQQCIEWDVWLYYCKYLLIQNPIYIGSVLRNVKLSSRLHLDYNNAQELVGFPGRIQVASDNPRARQFELVETRYLISQFKEHNIWKVEIEKLKREEKKLRDEGKSEREKLVKAARHICSRISRFYRFQANAITRDKNIKKNRKRSRSELNTGSDCNSFAVLAFSEVFRDDAENEYRTEHTPTEQ
ncbi:hypothetical protein BGAL_0366g00040 [Botrytis galanthina]|uniref:Uncharacterized protein n=1 Tax=Botrytis galanthina TaxID=278940 RepID=A0A4S8QNP1_9HELO|nr:hypothetical protein BGAL_0366g00040 [Botrytis galanthina]